MLMFNVMVTEWADGDVHTTETRVNNGNVIGNASDTGYNFKSINNKLLCRKCVKTKH